MRCVCRSLYRTVAGAVLLLIAGSGIAVAQTNVYFFYGDGCPHCAEQEEFFERIEADHSEMVIHRYEVWHDGGNARLFADFARAYGAEAGGVPITFIGNTMIVGFSQERADEILTALQTARRFGAFDPYENYRTYKLTGATVDGRASTMVPVLGEVSGMSLPLLSVTLGFLDGFNPCAFFVLFFLLSVLVNAGSRRTMLLIGGVFVLFSALVYYLFMAAWLNLFLLTRSLAFVMPAAGLVAIVIGGLNTKDYFAFKSGVSLGISTRQRTRLVGRMRGLAKEASIPAMIGATVLLAASANLYELLCTVGFPMVFTGVLSVHELAPIAYYGYMALYVGVYVVPFIAIVLAFTFVLGARRLTEQQGRLLKLLSGLMMLGLGVLLVAFPRLLTNVIVTGTILGGAIVLAFVIRMITGRLLHSGP